MLVGYLLEQIRLSLALLLGHLLACFSDTFTKQGVQSFTPILQLIQLMELETRLQESIRGSRRS